MVWTGRGVGSEKGVVFRRNDDRMTVKSEKRGNLDPWMDSSNRQPAESRVEEKQTTKERREEEKEKGKTDEEEEGTKYKKGIQKIARMRNRWGLRKGD